MSKETAPNNEDQATGQQTPELHQVQAVSDAASAKSSDDNATEGRPGMSRFEKWQLLLASFGALLAFGGLIVLDKQTVLMTRQTELLDSQTELLSRQTTVTEQQSKLMGDQNTLMGLQNDLMGGQTALMQQSEDSTIRYQRAIVNFNGIATKMRVAKEDPVWRLPAVNFSVLISVEWENTGPTQTRKAVTSLRFHPMRKGGERIDYPFGNRGPQELAIGPNSSDSSILQDVPIGFMDSDALISMYVSGWIAYRDVFPNTPPRLTEFCREIGNVSMNSEDIVFSPDPLEVETRRACPADCSGEDCPDNHNCCDEECPDYAERIRQAGLGP